MSTTNSSNPPAPSPTTPSALASWRTTLTQHPAFGGGVGVSAVILLRFGLSLLNENDAVGQGALLVLASVTITMIVGWIWNPWAAWTTALTAAALAVVGSDIHLGALGKLIVVFLILGKTGAFLGALARERQEKIAAQAQAKALQRERDLRAEAEHQAHEERHRAQIAADEQRAVLMTLQKETLTESRPRISGLQIDLAYLPAGAAALVGGDFFNIFRISDTQAAVILGDVTGKGAQAAAGGLVISSMLRALFAESRSPAAVLRRLNLALVSDPDFKAFATLFAAIVDGENRTILYANAGQEEPCLVSSWGNLRRLETTGTVVGALPDADFQEIEVRAEPGDVLIAFTDGLTEIRLPHGGWMEPGRMYAYLAELGGYPPDAITRQVLAWARRTAAGNLRDDAALLAIRFDELREKETETPESASVVSPSNPLRLQG